jgi:phenylacetate-CoA ligase
MSWQFESAVGGVVWPAIPDYGRAAVLALLHQVEQSQWWPPASIAAGQDRQLQTLLRHAWDTVPFYRQLWAGHYDAATPGTPARLPLLSRRMLQENFDALRSRNVPPAHGGLSEARTSGSSGSPVRVLKTDVSGLFWNALTLRDHAWHRRDLGRKLAVIRRGGHAAAPSWGPATAGLVRTGSCVARDVDAGAEAHLDWLAQEQPGYLLTYPSLVEELA